MNYKITNVNVITDDILSGLENKVIYRGLELKAELSGREFKKTKVFINNSSISDNLINKLEDVIKEIEDELNNK